MRSIYDNIGVGSQTPAYMQNVNGTLTFTGAAFDTKGYATAELNAYLGLGSTTGSFSGTATLQECSTSGGTYTNAIANDGNTIQVALTGAWSGGAVQAGAARIEGLGQNRKRYLKVQYVITSNAAQTGNGYAELIAGRYSNNPVQTGSNDT